MDEMFASDAELFNAVKLGDRKAFDLLYERYWAIVYKKSFSYLHDPEVCGEIVNDIFLNIWLKRDKLQVITFKYYLIAAARNRVYNFLKTKKGARLTYVEDYEAFANESQNASFCESNSSVVELRYRLNRLLDQLPKRCKEIFILSRITQLTNSEIALKLSVSKRTVENQISVAVKYLKDHISSLTILCFVLDRLLNK